MKNAGWAVHTAVDLAVWPLAVIFSPVIVMAGEPVNRYVMRWADTFASTPTAQTSPGDQSAGALLVPLPAAPSLALAVISNPLWIALTAPGRRVADRAYRPPARQAGAAAQ